MTTMQQLNGRPHREADLPVNYSWLIARELGLAARQLPRLLKGTGLSVAKFLSEDCLLTTPQQVRILRNAMMLSGQWQGKGVFNMEEFDPDPFMEMLNQHGLPWTLEELEAPLAF